MTALEGVFSVLPTPFTPGDAVDHDSLRRVIDLNLAAGVNGLTALGVTGEASRLSERERGEVLATVLSHVAGRVPVVAGTTAEGTTLCLEWSRAARAAGASAVMVSPPRMPKLNSDAVVRHFAALAAARWTFRSWSRTTRRSPATRWRRRCSFGSPARSPPRGRSSSRTRRRPSRRRGSWRRRRAWSLQIFGGLGGVFLLEELLAGATGAMTGFAYPEILVAIVRLFRSGDRATRPRTSSTATSR